jgi:uncharacterized membrane protein YfcA
MARHGLVNVKAALPFGGAAFMYAAGMGLFHQQPESEWPAIGVMLSYLIFYLLQ